MRKINKIFNYAITYHWLPTMGEAVVNNNQGGQEELKDAFSRIYLS